MSARREHGGEAPGAQLTVRELMPWALTLLGLLAVALLWLNVLRPSADVRSQNDDYLILQAGQTAQIPVTGLGEVGRVTVLLDDTPVGSSIPVNDDSRTVDVAIATNVQPGNHTLVMRAADGNEIELPVYISNVGWTTLRILGSLLVAGTVGLVVLRLRIRAAGGM